MSAGPEVEVAVIGAGVAGLAAALELSAGGAEVAVLEAGAAPGGALQSESAGGFLFERGANAFQVKPAALAFLRRHGLADRLLEAGPEARLRYLLRESGLEAVPTSLAGALRTPLLSVRGKLRALGEPFVPRGDAAHESVAAFVSRRLGQEVLDGLVAPFLIGVYAGDETRLGAEAVFPALVGFERERGSIARGALAAARDRARPRGLPGSWSLREGLGALGRAMAERLGERVALGARAEALAREGTGFRIEWGGARSGGLRARSVVLALPAHRAPPLVRSLDPELAEGLARVEYAPLASVGVAVDPAAARVPIRGFGFLVPRASGLDLLGALFTSRVFPGRAPAGRELLTCMLGGARWPGAPEAPDDALLARVGEGLERALGLSGAPEAVAFARWARAVPQPDRDHPRLVARLRELAERAGPLRLAGGYLDGVAVADAMASGVRAADALRSASPGARQAP